MNVFHFVEDSRPRYYSKPAFRRRTQNSSFYQSLACEYFGTPFFLSEQAGKLHTTSENLDVLNHSHK